jgi:branched-chain amino acid transport system ATP-binding protein
MPVLISVKNLNVSYGSIHAIKGISFEVNQGEIVSLIGSNGAGKTTTLGAISGIVDSTGEIIFDGKNISSNSSVPAHERVALGLAQSPEGRGIFAQMSVRENLEMGAYFRKNSKTLHQEMEECFKIFPRLKEREKQIAGTLSGGEQQMLAISRALMAKPKLLLLDEPSLGLAPKIVAQIFEIVKDLNRAGVTILLVEQNARMALKISHRAYVLETGKITLSGKGLDLLGDDSVRRSYLGG